jgi:hypothetical protein
MLNPRQPHLWKKRKSDAVPRYTPGFPVRVVEANYNPWENNNKTVFVIGFNMSYQGYTIKMAARSGGEEEIYCDREIVRNGPPGSYVGV